MNVILDAVADIICRQIQSQAVTQQMQYRKTSRY